MQLAFSTYSTCISTANVIQAITAIATLILAYMAYKQISLSEIRSKTNNDGNETQL